MSGPSAKTTQLSQLKLKYTLEDHQARTRGTLGGLGTVSFRLHIRYPNRKANTSPKKELHWKVQAFETVPSLGLVTCQVPFRSLIDDTFSTKCRRKARKVLPRHGRKTCRLLALQVILGMCLSVVLLEPFPAMYLQLCLRLSVPDQGRRLR